jgi:hypothetical protein
MQPIVQKRVIAALLFLSLARVNAQPAPSCQLGREPGSIQHVVYIQFDNTHLRRDIPEVPSDLEQNPHSYQSDGRVITQVLHESARARSLDDDHRGHTEELGERYKQLNASFGRFAQALLRVSTHALTGDDAKYAELEGKIDSLTDRRDEPAAEIRSALDGAEFDGQPINRWDARRWMEEADRLIDEATDLARR